MDQNLPRLYKDYGEYSNYRNFPLDIDGLKPVERRVLLSAYKIAREKLVKSRQVDAYTIGHYHPHGECVTGDTKILLLNGKKVKIKDLVGKKSFWVYSCTSDGIIKPGLGHSARMVKKTSKLYKIYFNNNTFFECTEDHPVMLRDGSFKEAKNLNINDSVMPLKLRTEDYNHTITKIEIINLQKAVEVYDLSVDKYHNFAIDCGVFIHNCYGTIVQLVRQGFLIGQGNFGTNVGVEPVGPAAPRYTECRMHPKTLEMAFQYIKHVPWVESELGDTEPTHLPTMFPICLMGTEYTQGIGFGFKTFIPCYAVEDLYKRLLWLIGVRKRQPIIAPLTDCKIVADKKQLEKLLTTGKAKIDVEGIVDINKRENKATLRSWPPGKRFQTFLTQFSQELNDGMIGFTDLSVSETDIVFQVIRERNRDRIFDQFIEKLIGVNKGSISFENVVVDSKRMVLTKSIDNMLLDTYSAFSKANESMLQYEINKIDDTIMEYAALLKIRPVIAKGISKKLTPDKILDEIESVTDVSKEVAQGLMSKYKINKLLTIDMDTTILQNSKKELIKHLADLDTFVLDQYSNF